MAHVQPARPLVSLPKKFANFTNSAAGLDLTLRLIQAVSIIAAEVFINNSIVVVGCVTATSQLALGRRYLRLFSFISCFERVRDVLTGDVPLAGSVLTAMELVESSCLGLYLILESLTILHDMNIWLVSWYTPILIEGNKFWFYAICTEAKLQETNQSTDEKKGQEKPPPLTPVPSTTSLLRQLVADSCDLTLPASFLGWVNPGGLGVGCAMVIHQRRPPPMDPPSVHDEKKSSEGAVDETYSHDEEVTLGHSGSQELHRKLRGRQVQLFAIGGAIGTSLFVQMGAALPKGGPAGLFLGFVAYGSIVLAVNQCFAEMVCYMPIPSPFVRLAGHWVDEALSFAMGWNFFLTMALGIPYEIAALNVLLTYWTDKVPVAAVVAICIVLYAVLNILTVRYYGVSEFYLSIFKVLLMIGLIAYTFITMVGGNPDRDPYGFRYWKNPGSFVEYLTPGDTGRFLGILACMVQGSFTMVGPEFISMAAGEAERPRRVMYKAYSSFVWRLMFFFLVGALAIGIVVPYNDKTLSDTLSGDRKGSGTGAASPYVISMDKFGIPVLPHIVNAGIMTSVFSAGNNLVFSASRTLYGMSIEGKAFAIFSKCSRAGVPYYAVAFSMLFCLLGFLQVSNGSATVLNWLVGCITASYLLNYFGTCITYLHFYKSIKLQGVDRDTLPYKGYFQPYAAWYAVCGTGIMTLILGYNLFITGHWDLASFFLDYVMVAFFILTFVFWKVFKRTKYVRPGTADLQLGNTKNEIDAYEAAYVPPNRGKIGSYVNRIFE
ncbi:hypothetical protein V494_02023 [Pseudogymnoascus sp. VKM F-4513 (FW-928)]|nr:hypothetical protein V494_02023 [Pseudogymnoascus sp. VKM F-4513 (FW-928)]